MTLAATPPAVATRVLGAALAAFGPDAGAQAPAYVALGEPAAASLEAGLAFAPAAALTDETCGLAVAGALAAPGWAPVEHDHWEGDHAHCTWYRLGVRSAAPAGTWFADLGYHAFAELYVVRGDSVAEALRTGNELPLAERAVAIAWAKTYRNLVPLPLEPGVAYEIAWRVYDPYGPNIYGKNDDQRLGLVPAAAVAANAERHRVIAAFFHGWLATLLLYHLAQWAVARSELVGWYCALLAALLAYVSYEEFVPHALAPRRVIGDQWLALTACGSFAVFFQFARVLLHTVGLRRGGVRSVLGWVAWGNVALGLAWAGAYLLRRAGAAAVTPVLAAMPELFRAAALASLVSYLGVLAYAYRRASGAAFRMFLASNAAVVLAVAVYLAEAYLVPYGDRPAVGAVLKALAPVLNYLVELGIGLMGLGFAVAVALLTKERDLERDRAYRRSLAAAEMKALRSQMNPHFLFNGLNAVKRFVIRSRPREAADYLTKFAGLVRRVLQNSLSPLVPLAEELETLRLYVEMERLRFERPFAFELAVAPGLDADDLEIPAALVQPYVENAIWHGLYPLAGRPGRLRVAVARPGGTAGPLRITVEDDGVGRATAGILSAERARGRRSLGMALTAERMRLVERVYGIAASVEVTDLLDEGGAARGTRVEVVIGVG